MQKRYIFKMNELNRLLALNKKTKDSKEPNYIRFMLASGDLKQ